MPRVRSLDVVPATLVAAAFALLVGGCGSTSNHVPAVSGNQPIVPTPSTSAATSTPPATPSPAATTAPATLADRLVPVADAPGLTATWHWQDGGTGPADAAPFGPCAKADLGSIGAVEVVQRKYFPPVDTDDHAAEQVAEFPDTATAARAAAVLRSWHDKCAQTLNRSDASISAITPVAVSTGAGSWYVVALGPRNGDEPRFDTFGIVLSGTRIALTSIEYGGKGYHYLPGKEPIIAMVGAAAALLGA